MTPSTSAERWTSEAQRFQTLSTTVTDADTGIAVRFDMYPVIQPENGPLSNPIGYLEALAFQIPPSNLPPLFVDTDFLSARPGSFDLEVALETIVAEEVLEADWDAASDFLRFVATKPLVPFRASPIEGRSLAQLTAGVVPAGAMLGYAVGGTGPLLILTVPGGIVVCGAAAGIAAALQAGLGEQIYRRIAPRDVSDDEDG